MTSRTFFRLIDAAFPGKGGGGLPVEGALAVRLLPEDGEYAATIRKLAALGDEGPLGPGVPDEVFLHLYAHEALERMREQAALEDGPGKAVLVLPFWPETLFEAAGLAVHGAEEIQALFPRVEETFYASRPADQVEAEAVRVLGRIRFDAADYSRALETKAKKNGWTRHEPD